MSNHRFDPGSRPIGGNASPAAVQGREAAIREGAHPGARPERLRVLAEVLLLAGGAFLGYAIGETNRDKPNVALIAVTMLTGSLLGIGAIVIKSKKLD